MKRSECKLPKEKCQALFDKVIQALDGNLTNEQEQHLLREIEKHPCCFEKMNMEKSFKEFLCNKLTRKEVPLELVASIKDKVHEMSYHLDR